MAVIGAGPSLRREVAPVSGGVSGSPTGDSARKGPAGDFGWPEMTRFLVIFGCCIQFFDKQLWSFFGVNFNSSKKLAFCSIMISWFRVRFRVGFRGLSPYSSGILFHHHFLLPSGSSYGSGVCLPTFLSFLLSGKGFCPIMIVSLLFFRFFSQEWGYPWINSLLRMSVVETWFVAVWGLCWCNLIMEVTRVWIFWRSWWCDYSQAMGNAFFEEIEELLKQQDERISECSLIKKRSHKAKSFHHGLRNWGFPNDFEWHGKYYT